MAGLWACLPASALQDVKPQLRSHQRGHRCPRVKAGQEMRTAFEREALGYKSLDCGLELWHATRRAAHTLALIPVSHMGSSLVL
jgi:hypothetical protein